MKRAILGDVELSVVEGDNPKESVDVTEKPVENGQDIADHIKKKATTISISGIVVGEDASQKLEKLKKYQREGEILVYVNRVAYHNMVIESIDTKHDTSIGNGFKFNIGLKMVRIAVAKEVNIKAPPSRNSSKKTNTKATKTKVKKKSNAGRKQPKTKRLVTV